MIGLKRKGWVSILGELKNGVLGGAAVKTLGLTQGEVVMDISASIAGKSTYFDRRTPEKH